MLVLSRKYGEEIIVNGPCKLVVVGIRGGSVRLGIVADRGVSIMRGELLEKAPGQGNEHEGTANVDG